MNTLKDRIEEIFRDFDLEVGSLAKIAGVSSSAVSQWIGKGKGRPVQTIGKQEAAERIEKHTGLCALWVAKGKGPKYPTAGNISGTASMSFSAKGTMTAAVTLEDALAEVAKTMLMADDLAKIQAKPLLAHLIENPDQADKIIPRLVALLDGEPLTTETKDFLHAKQPS